MRTVKIIDTCTLINIFDGPDQDLKQILSGYDVATTDTVISEYVCKYPRVIPDILTVYGLSEDEKRLSDELEYLFPNLASGERSVMALALRMAREGRRVVVITDDQRALKKLSRYSADPSVTDLFEGSAGIIWGDKVALREHFIADRIDRPI